MSYLYGIMSRRNFWYLAFVFAMGSALIAYVFFVHLNPREEVPGSYQDQMQYWSKYFDTYSAKKAYAHFIDVATKQSYTDAHTIAHIIGDELYRRQGEKGITLCTSDFGFGCYHGFSGAVLHDRGLSMVAQLGAVCEEMKDGAYLGCIHGIGHGILAFVGVDELQKALEACKPAQRALPIGGCLGGVIMEYNFHTMQSENGIELRDFSAANAYQPCVDIEAEFKAACFYEQPSWWHASMESRGGVSHLDMFRRIGELCAKIPETENRDICFRGAGNVAGPRSDYVAAVMRDWCSQMPSQAAFDACYSEALSHLFQHSEGQAQLRTLCSTKQVSYPNVCKSDSL